MGKVVKLKFPDKIWLCCDSCGKMSFELIFEDGQFDEDRGGICFLTCKTRGCGERYRASIDWSIFDQGSN